MWMPVVVHDVTPPPCVVHAVPVQMTASATTRRRGASRRGRGVGRAKAWQTCRPTGPAPLVEQSATPSVPRSAHAASSMMTSSPRPSPAGRSSRASTWRARARAMTRTRTALLTVRVLAHVQHAAVFVRFLSSLRLWCRYCRGVTPVARRRCKALPFTLVYPRRVVCSCGVVVVGPSGRGRRADAVQARWCWCAASAVAEARAVPPLWRTRVHGAGPVDDGGYHRVCEHRPLSARSSRPLATARAAS